MRTLIGVVFILVLLASPFASAQDARVLSLRMIIVRTLVDADDVLARLKAGEPMEALARKYSIDSSASAGGILPRMAFTELRTEIQRVVQGLRPGEVSAVTRLGSGYALFQLVSEEVPAEVALVEAIQKKDSAGVQNLIKGGADVNATFDDGATILMVAAANSSPEVVRLLIEAGAKVAATAKNGSTALLEASFAGRAEVVRTLLDAGANPNARMEDTTTILMKAALAGHDDVVLALIGSGAEVNAKAQNGLTALMQAAFAGHLNAVRILISNRADVNAPLDNGSTALMAASAGGREDVVRALIEAGGKVNAKTNNGSTALLEAAHGGHTATVRALLTAGADVNARIDTGVTALMAAALGGHVETIRTLVAAGADLNLRDRNGWNVLKHAAASANPDAVKTLLETRITISAEERSILIGSTNVNEFYSSNDPNLLKLAASEFQRVLDVSPNNLPALEWLAAVEVLQWNKTPDLQQFQRANSLLRKALDLAPTDPERHYWLAAIALIFVDQTKNASSAEYSTILDEGIEFARKAIAADPKYWDAMAVLAKLYQKKAGIAPTPTAKNELSALADAATRDAIRWRDAKSGKPARPNDQFSTPAPPPPPL